MEAENEIEAAHWALEMSGYQHGTWCACKRKGRWFCVNGWSHDGLEYIFKNGCLTFVTSGYTPPKGL
jgi:hypothetical protein